MINLAAAVATAIFLPQQASLDQLNEALRIDGPAAASIFEKGYRDAGRSRDDRRQVDRLRREIGGAKRVKGTISFLWAQPASLAIYDEGFRARKGYLGSPQVDREVTNLSRGTFLSHPIIQFRGHLAISAAAGSRHDNRQATVADLNNVRVVLKVGDRIYEPFAEPGHGDNQPSETFHPYTELGETRGFWNRTISAFTEWSRPFASSTTSYNVVHSEDFEWYALDFRVGFSLFNEDGSARITPADKDFDVIMVVGPTERRAHYHVSDLAFR